MREKARWIQSRKGRKGRRKDFHLFPCPCCFLVSVLFLARPSGRCLMPARINGIARSSPSVRAKMTQHEGRRGEASLREMK